MKSLLLKLWSRKLWVLIGNFILVLTSSLPQGKLTLVGIVSAVYIAAQGAVDHAQAKNL